LTVTNVSADFLKRTQVMLKHMRQRFGNILPFELDEFRAWLLEQFEGAEAKAIRCPYCRRVFITVFTCVIDHKQPASRGGALGTDNLCACCQKCNDLKGALGAEAFEKLCRYLDAIDPLDAKEIRERLESSYKAKASLARMHRERNRGRVQIRPHGWAR